MKFKILKQDDKFAIVDESETVHFGKYDTQEDAEQAKIYWEAYYNSEPGA